MKEMEEARSQGWPKKKKMQEVKELGRQREDNGAEGQWRQKTDDESQNEKDKRWRMAKKRNGEKEQMTEGTKEEGEKGNVMEVIAMKDKRDER